MAINFQVGKIELSPEQAPAEKPMTVQEIVDSVDVPIKVEINMTRIKEMFNKAEAAIKTMVGVADKLVVNDDRSKNTAIDMGVSIAKFEKLIEDKRKEIKAPYLKFGQQLDGLCKPVKKLTEEIKSGLKSKIKGHIAVLEIRAAKARASEDEERRKAAAALQIEPEDIPVNDEPVIQSKHEAKSGSASIKKKWAYEIVHEPDVPLRYMMVNDKMVKEALTRGIRDIKGLRIFEDSNVQFNAKR